MGSCIWSPPHSPGCWLCMLFTCGGGDTPCGKSSDSSIILSGYAGWWWFNGGRPPELAKFCTCANWMEEREWNLIQLFLNWDSACEGNCPNSTHIVCVLGLLLSQPGNAQHFGGFQERAQRPLVDIHLAVVDELDQRMEVSKCHVL